MLHWQTIASSPSLALPRPPPPPPSFQTSVNGSPPSPVAALSSTVTPTAGGGLDSPHSGGPALLSPSSVDPGPVTLASAAAVPSGTGAADGPGGAGAGEGDGPAAVVRPRVLSTDVGDDDDGAAAALALSPAALASVKQDRLVLYDTLIAFSALDDAVGYVHAR
jgi:hypothetical protein